MSAPLAGRSMSVGRIVLLTDLLGALALLLAVFLAPALPQRGEPLLSTSVVLLGFLALTVVGQLAYVRVRHGLTYEDLTFFEVAVAAGVLLIEPLPLIAVTLLGVLAAELAIRRPALKIAFNLGMYAISTSLMVVVFHVLQGGSDPFSWRSVAALVVASAVFAAVNLTILSILLSSHSGAPVGTIVGEEWALSAFMAIGSVGVGSVGVALAMFAPALLPFSALPALALWYAYAAAAQHAEARERNRWLVHLSGVIAQHGRDTDTLVEAAEAIRQVVGAPALEILNPREPDAAQARLIASLGERTDPLVLRASDLPPEWTYGVATRLDLGSPEPGAILLGTTMRPRESRLFAFALRPGWTLAEADAPVLSAMVAAMGSSLRAGATLKALSEETAKLTAVVDNTSDGIAVVDDTGRVRLWSRTMARMTGVTGEELAGLGGPAANPEVVQTLLRHAWNAEDDAAAHPTTTRVHLVRPDGEELDVLVSTVRLQESAASANSDTAGWVSILTVHDETRERRVDQMKTDFVATISHELRTPITPIKGYAHLLAKRGDRLSPEKRMQALQTISDRADHLTRLVDDLLLASRVSDGARLAVEIGVEYLADVISQAIASFPRLSGRIRADLPSEPVAIQCDRVRAVQCLANLLGNAEKYTPADSPIEVRVETTPMLVGIHVRDYGPGIPAAERARVFDRFYRLENPMTRQTGGAGLGLHIARELAVAMGGGLTLQEPLGAGAEFVFHLPTAAAPSVASARAGEPPLPSARAELPLTAHDLASPGSPPGLPGTSRTGGIGGGPPF
ncbi:MAG: ATP-binding protein [Candidatus Nanopelagicales bacterium]